MLPLGAASSSLRSEREGRVGENTGNEVEDMRHKPSQSSVRSNDWLLTKAKKTRKKRLRPISSRITKDLLLMWPKRGGFFAGLKWKIPRGQDGSSVLARRSR